MIENQNSNDKLAAGSTSLSAEFLLAEFNTLQNRASVLESNKSNRVNFMLILAAGVMAGIGPIISIPNFTTFSKVDHPFCRHGDPFVGHFYSSAKYR